jgi:hypothetical protein
MASMLDTQKRNIPSPLRLVWGLLLGLPFLTAAAFAQGPAESSAQIAPNAFVIVAPSVEPSAVATLRTKRGADNVTLMQLNPNVLSAATDAPVTLNLTPSLRFTGVTRETRVLGE